MSQIEKEKMMLQHRMNEYQRKAEQESEKRRNVENEGKLTICRYSSCNVGGRAVGLRNVGSE